MRILSSGSFISTSVWLHHLDFNKMPGVKIKWGLQMNAECFLNKILEAAPYKIAVVRPLTSHLANDPSKMSKTCWTQLGK